jgi:hypothetical protein
MKRFYKEENEPIPEIIYSEIQPPTNAEGNNYVLIEDNDELNALYYKLNSKMKIDGEEYSASFKVVTFGQAYRDGLITASNVDYLYTKLSGLIIRLNDGNWDAALHHLQNVLNTITQEDIDNGYTQEIHDQIETDFNNYINK